MSIFKVKQWWSNNKLQDNEIKSGIHSAGCLRVNRFSSYSDGDCIIVGEEYLLKIYKPSPNQETSDTLLEAHLGDVILQIETGKFLAGAADRQILVLHPQSYTIYELRRKEGHTDAGEQNVLEPMVKHSFVKKAHSLTYGPFGNVKTRDFICIQSLDGHLSFFDQDTALFTYNFSDIIIPGPVCYVPSSDLFVICKSTWVLEIYSYQQLREFSEVNARLKNIPQWIYNAGEEVSTVQVIQTSSNFSSIVALGERHLYCFQDNGLMKYMIKFDYTPVCFHAYLIGWFYEPTARLLVMVSSEDSKLFVYEGTTLLWSCDLLNRPISISRCFLRYLPGGLITLFANGEVNVNVLGTEPDLNTKAGSMMNETIDPEAIQAELEVVEEQLESILGNKAEETSGQSIEQLIKIKADVGKPVQNLKGYNDDGVLHLLMCPLVIMMSCNDPKLIQSVQITYHCCPAFACSDSTICLEEINGTEIIETQVFMACEMDVAETKVEIFFTVTDSIGKISVFSRYIMLPISLYCTPTDLESEDELQLHISSNHSCIELTKIFTDFSEEELLKQGSSVNAITLTYRNTKKNVTVRSYGNFYSIEASDFLEVIAVMEHFIFRLEDHYARMGIKDFKYHIKIGKELNKQLIHKFLKSIETHAKERVRLKKFEDELNVLHKQFTLVQKKLLVQYGSLPPGDCDPLEMLMRDTHRRLTETVQEILQCKENVSKSGGALASVGHLIVYILKRTINDDFKIKLIEEMLALDTVYDLYQEWEEAVTQALSYILNNVLQKSEKDKEKLAPVTEQCILSQLNLKKFLKQIRLVLEKMFSEALANDDSANSELKEVVPRIEEFVEVL